MFKTILVVDRDKPMNLVYDLSMTVGLSTGGRSSRGCGRRTWCNMGKCNLSIREQEVGAASSGIKSVFPRSLIMHDSVTKNPSGIF